VLVTAALVRTGNPVPRNARPLTGHAARAPQRWVQSPAYITDLPVRAHSHGRRPLSRSGASSAPKDR